VGAAWSSCYSVSIALTLIMFLCALSFPSSLLIGFRRVEWKTGATFHLSSNERRSRRNFLYVFGSQPRCLFTTFSASLWVFWRHLVNQLLYPHRIHDR
jgi:hypothetical protein